MRLPFHYHPGTETVFDRDYKVVAKIAMTPWGKYKIIGEDTYFKTIIEMLQRLEERHVREHQRSHDSV